MLKSSIWIALLLSFAQPMLGQVGNAQVAGEVKDPSGASLPQVKIVVTNTDTGVARDVETNREGLYVVPLLTPGNYRLKAVRDGFRTITRDGITLRVDQIARVDLKMELGATSDSVSVTAEAPALNTDDSQVGQVMSNRQIVSLPLNSRNYLELARLAAGTTAAAGSRMAGQGAYSVAGQDAYQTNVILDGMDNNSRGSGGQLGLEAQVVTPSVDAVQEFKVITNNNSAEYGFRMGGAVIVNTKSGTNAFHGSLYEFLRNDRMDATNFFAVGSPKPPYKSNQFGGTIGGPILHNRTFFFASVEEFRIRLGQSSIATVPNQQVRSGDFSAVRPIYDPLTTRETTPGTFVRDRFPGDRIPVSRFDPVAAQAIGLYPNPNRAGAANNYFFAGSNQNDNTQIDTRLDHLITDKHRIFARYSRRANDQLQPGPLPLPADGAAWQTQSLVAHSGVANLNSTLSPSLNNELRFGFSRVESLLDIPWTENYNAKLGIKGLPDLGDDNARGMAALSPVGYAALGSRNAVPNRNNMDLLQIADNVLWIRGRHSFKAGIDFRREVMFRRTARLARGSFGFDGSFTQNPASRGNTGDGLADFLLGLANTATFGNALGETMNTLYYAGFFQDDWRVNSRLTLNLGLRWDYFGSPSFPNGNVNNFLFPSGPNYQVVRPGNSGDCGCEHDWNNFAPRLGLAFQARPGTVVRSGFGIFYGSADLSQTQSAHFFNQAPEYTEITLPSDRLLQPAAVLSTGLPGSRLDSGEILANTTVRTAPRFLPTQYAMQWFMDVQHQLPWQSVVTVGYVGSGTRHLNQARNLNQPLTPGAATIKSRQPYPFFSGVTLSDPAGNSSYQALSVKLEKRFSHGLSLLANYTWSHTIDNVQEFLNGTAGQALVDNYNLDLNHGNSVFDVRHQFVSSVVFDLPFGAGRHYLSHAGPVDWVLGGWQIASIVRARSGFPFTPIVSTDLTNTGTQNRPNRLGSGELPDDQRSIDRWFDLRAFATAAPYVYGNSGRNILFGPGQRNVDLKLSKAFRFAETRRVEFRCEMFNFTNTPAFGLPNPNINLPAGGRITAAGAPRQIQLALKLVF